MRRSRRGRCPVRVPRVQLCLPPLSGREASVLIAILESAIDAIWRTHGPAIEEHRGLHVIGTSPSSTTIDPPLF